MKRKEENRGEKRKWLDEIGYLDKMVINDS